MNVSRADIAAALSLVEGVKGHVHRPKSPTRGDAWPLVGSLERGRGLTFSRVWRIVLLLGGDPTKADDLLEQLLPEIAITLQEQDVLFVTTAVPFIVTTEAGDIYAAEITGRGD